MVVRPAWEVRELEGGTSVTSSWFQVRLAFPDGARVVALAVLSEGRVSIEDVNARPALSLADLTVLADWIEGPLSEACGVRAGSEGVGDRCEVVGDGEAAEGGAGHADDGDRDDAQGFGDAQRCDEGAEPAGTSHSRAAWPRGAEGRRLVAQEYRAAQEDGIDPVLAVMCATGCSRRRSLRLISKARDAGFLAPRHARR
ncbi:DUF6214 family protein [Streptomyces sp. NPDC046805]|uniref:DUF6214 family protein n=1 Tax=Streptomyces sp. NPDC046805 TaxID=3155134 RepID=UPI0033E777B9